MSRKRDDTRARMRRPRQAAGGAGADLKAIEKRATFQAAQSTGEDDTRVLPAQDFDVLMERARKADELEALIANTKHDDPLYWRRAFDQMCNERDRLQAALDRRNEEELPPLMNAHERRVAEELKEPFKELDLGPKLDR